MINFGKFRPSLSCIPARWPLAALAALLLTSLAGCSLVETTYRVGAVHPLTGDGARYGVPMERVIQRAVRDINQEWADESRHIELIFDDGKCHQEEARAAAQRMVEDSDVNIIYGGSCSDETLGMAPYTEANYVLLLTPLSTSSAISQAGEYVFRNIPDNTASVRATVDALPEGQFRRFALLSNATAYSQDLRGLFTQMLTDTGGEIVADEIVPSGEGDYSAEAARIVAANPDFVVIMPQTIPDTGYLLQPLRDAGYDGPGAGNMVTGVSDAIDEYIDLLEGFYLPHLRFKGQNLEKFAELKADTDCNLDHYCAIAYDGMVLISQMLTACGDHDTACMRDYLYGTQNWDGPYFGVISFDINGDVDGNFIVNRIENGAPTPLRPMR